MATDSPVLIAFVSDLFFSVRIEDVARKLAFQVIRVDHPDVIGPENEAEPVHLPGEPLAGRSGTLIAWLTEVQPAILVFEIDSAVIPWYRWIATIKSAPATRRIPILCFGSHVNVETQQRAKDAGADVVVGKSRFTQALPELVRKLARVPDSAAIETACGEPLSARARKGIALFNAGEYYEAHEELEHAWMEDASSARELYRAILQVAVAYLQIERQNFNGAAKMFLRARQWLRPLPEHCRGVDVGQLRADAERVQAQLERLGPEGIAEFDLTLFNPIVLL